jgi:outer membrane protein assembly factor BamA
MYNFFLEGFKQSTSIEEVYKPYYYHQVALDWKERIALPWYRNTLELRIKLGCIDRPVDPFFKLHLGGPTMMRGYTYYSLEGRKTVLGSVTYRTPIFRNIRWKLGPLYFDKLYGAVLGDIGRAWDADADNWKAKGFKRDVGAQLRLDLISYYSFPLGVSLEAAHGLDEAEGRNPWKWYFSLLFGYD